jgi:ABC-type amino acid transport substrate-binding protein
MSPKENAMILFRLLGLTVLAAALAAAPAGADFPEIKARGVLKVLRMDAPAGDEFFSLAAGDDPGFDREILEGFAALHRLKVETITVPSWKDLAPGLLQRKGDVAGGRFTITEARQRQVSFTAEVFPTRYVVITRKPRPVIHSLDVLRGQRLAAVPGTAVEEAILAAGVPKANVSPVTALGGVTGTDALRDGRATASVLGVERALRDVRADPELQLGMFVGQPRSLAYAVRKEDTELLQALNAYIDNIRHSGTWSRLVVKYFGSSAMDILKSVREQ